MFEILPGEGLEAGTVEGTEVKKVEESVGEGV
jgi:hypothetical protein